MRFHQSTIQAETIITCYTNAIFRWQVFCVFVFFLSVVFHYANTYTSVSVQYQLLAILLSTFFFAFGTSPFTLNIFFALKQQIGCVVCTLFIPTWKAKKSANLSALWTMNVRHTYVRSDNELMSIIYSFRMCAFSLPILFCIRRLIPRLRTRVCARTLL